MKKMTRRFAAGIAAATLSLGVVACSDAEDAAKDAGDAAKSAATEATDAAGSAANDAKDSMKSSDSAEASDSEDADSSEGADSSESADAEGDMVGVSTADGEVEVSSDFANAIKEKAGEWGDPQSIETSADGDVATFAKDKLMTYSKDAGSQPIIGKIAETWTEDGGLQNKVGLPTGPEQESGDGWVQEFTNGTISWMKGESGEYEATVE